MPKIDKIFSLEITPEQFLSKCSAIELQEINILIQSPRFANRISEIEHQHKTLQKVTPSYCSKCDMITAFTEYPFYLSCKVCRNKKVK